MAKKIIRVISRAANGTLRTKEYENFDEIAELHSQIGIDDCSTDLSLRGLPLFRGLVGPMPESKTTVCYESPDVFEFLTKEWSQASTKRRRRVSTKIAEVVAEESSEPAVKPNFVPIPKMILSPIFDIAIVNR